MVTSRALVSDAFCCLLMLLLTAAAWQQAMEALSKFSQLSPNCMAFRQTEYMYGSIHHNSLATNR